MTDPPIAGGDLTAPALQALATQLEEAPRVSYRIYRAAEPIRSIERLAPIAEVGPLTAWNTDFYGRHPSPEAAALRYVIEDGGEPLPPESGLYVHNPQAPGRSWYAVTTVVDGVENTAITSENTLISPVQETTGSGLPVLQRIERPPAFHGVDQPMLRHYVRWEIPPIVLQALAILHFVRRRPDTYWI